jgi:hypothetical protein
LQHRIQTLKQVFENSNQETLFVTLNNTSKNEFKKEYMQEPVKINHLSKRAVQFLCKNNELKNLLEGNVLLLQAKDKKIDSKKILLNKSIHLNFLFSKQQIYRNQKRIINAPNNHQNTHFIFSSPTNYLLQTLYLLKK